MTVIICPGIHEDKVTDSFVAGLHSCGVRVAHELFSNRYSAEDSVNILVFSHHNLLVLSSINIVNFLTLHISNPSQTPVLFISFSAGVVGAIAAAWMWQAMGGKVKAFIAIDGWGVPLVGNFPIHRLSHDYFTHYSSACGLGVWENFYADPPVEHLDIWRSPQTTTGWYISASSAQRKYMNAAQFLHLLLQRYGEVEIMNYEL